jgi:DNA-binding transcriptional MerR regulator
MNKLRKKENSMRMAKRSFRIGELAKHLDVEKFVIRFWEKQFDIKTTRSIGGQRFYTQDDLNKFKQIKQLLYKDGFTISGAKKYLESTMHQDTFRIGTHTTSFDVNELEPHEELIKLKAHLVKLKQLL